MKYLIKYHQKYFGPNLSVLLPRIYKVANSLISVIPTKAEIQKCLKIQNAGLNPHDAEALF